MEPAYRFGGRPAVTLARQSKARVGCEILVAYALILAVIWSPRAAQHVLWWVAAAAVVFFTALSFHGVAAMGLHGKNFFRSLWIVAAALAVAAVAILIAAHAGTLRIPAGAQAFVREYLAYALWAFAQQFLLQSFFLVRFLRVLSAPWIAAAAAACIFAMAHLPNPILAPLTLLWGLAACGLFLRYRSVYALAVAHAIFGIAVAMTVPGPIDRNMRVGLGYLRYEHHPHDALHP